MSYVNRWRTADYLMFGVIMACMGSTYWGVRGSGGFGGGSGALLAGAGWATWWYLASYVGEGAGRRPYGSAWVLPAIALGIGIGGESGYGVYISWLNGKFNYNYPDAARQISPSIGYFMLFLCGLHWGGIAGAFLAWCAPVRPLRWWEWCLRIALGIGGGALALWWLRAYPQVHLPFYSEGIYDHPEYKDVQRTRTQIEPVGSHLGAFLGFLLFEIIRRDWRAVGVMVLMALGFAIPFSVGAVWHTFNDSGWNLGWWKHWEMSIGLGGGAAFALVFWLFNRPGDAERKDSISATTRFFTADALFWLVLVNNVYGAVKGRLKMHEVELSDTAVIAIILIGVGLCTVTVMLRWRGERIIDLQPDGNRPPLGPFLVVQGSILFAMLMVSIPRSMELANAVILGTYALYVAVSAFCAWRLDDRVGSVETIAYVTPGQRFRM